MEHYNQTPRRNADFIRPPNTLKEKVGSGGLSDEILDKAQKLLEESSVDFEPLANVYLDKLMIGINMAKDYGPEDDIEIVMSHMIYPSMQLKANGGMFRYDLITAMADKLIQLLEVLKEPDIEAVEIILAFHTTMKAVVQGKIVGSGGEHGQELLGALDGACLRYFNHKPGDERTDAMADIDLDFVEKE